MQDQFYLFQMPGDMCPVWCETFMDGIHTVAPTPYTHVADAMRQLKAANPAAVVDELCQDSDIEEVREWARTRPLEQIT